MPAYQDLSELHALHAALGWLELGMPQEALNEIDPLPKGLQGQPTILELRWAIHEQLNDWDRAAVIASQLVKAAPDRASSWINHAYATRRSTDGGLEKAYGILSSVVTDFPKEPTIPYNLACYTCQLNRPPAETIQWLERALAIGKRNEMIEMALRDKDLAPLRSQIEQLRDAKKR